MGHVPVEVYAPKTAGTFVTAIAAGLGFSVALDDGGFIHHWGTPGPARSIPAGGAGKPAKGHGILETIPKGRYLSIGAGVEHASAVAASNVPSIKRP